MAEEKFESDLNEEFDALMAGVDGSTVPPTKRQRTANEPSDVN